MGWIDHIQDRIAPIDYGINLPTFGCLVMPGVSLAIYKIRKKTFDQEIHCMRTEERIKPYDYKPFKKLNNASAFHVMGSLIQCVILAAAAFFQPLLIAFVPLSSYEFCIAMNDLQRCQKVLSNATQPDDSLQFISAYKIGDSAPHNAFPDLIYFKDQFFCCFREGEDHVPHQVKEAGSIRILTSKNGEEWKDEGLLRLQGIDLRDPKLSEMPGGCLMLSAGGAVLNQEGKVEAYKTYVAFSDDGRKWSEWQAAEPAGEWIWRVTWFQGTGYGISYRVNLHDKTAPWIATLFKTSDGIHYTAITQLNIPHNPSEGTLRFQKDGTAIALQRKRGKGLIGTSCPPYTDWKWKEIQEYLGGPNFLILPNGEMWAGSRSLIVKTPEDFLEFTSIAKMTPEGGYKNLFSFPAGEDGGYPGMVVHDHQLFAAFYSSHEGKASIYFAKFRLGE